MPVQRDDVVLYDLVMPGDLREPQLNELQMPHRGESGAYGTFLSLEEVLVRLGDSVSGV